VDAVAFTGSTDVGRLLLNYSAESNLKRVLLELGGKNPQVVLEDAGDLDYVARQAVNCVFWNMGENCSSGSRLIVHRKLKDKLLARMLQVSKEWIVGNPLDPATKVGPMIEESHMKKVLAYVESGKSEGARLVLGGLILLRLPAFEFLSGLSLGHVTELLHSAGKYLRGENAVLFVNCDILQTGEQARENALRRAHIDQQPAFRGIDLHPVLHRIGHPDVTVAVDGNALGHGKIPRTIAALAESTNKIAVGIEYLNAGIEHVRDVKIAFPVHGDSGWLGEIAWSGQRVVFARCADLAQQLEVVGVVDQHLVEIDIGDVEEAVFSVNRQSHRIGHTLGDDSLHTVQGTED